MRKLTAVALSNSQTELININCSPAKGIAKRVTGVIMLVVFLWILFTVLVGFWAKNWNRSAILWGLVAIILSPLFASICLLLVGNAKPSCPSCKEKVQPGAEVCKHCGHKL